MKKAGIIGGSGFIGSHITKVFLNAGYEVKVSTTNILREDKYEHLMTFNHSDNLHISELDVMDKATLKDFVSDCDIIVHSGTPFIPAFFMACSAISTICITGSIFSRMLKY